MKKVSVIIPVYNMERSLLVSINRIVSQTYSNIEIIIIDDGSKDNSLEICEKLRKENDCIQVIHTENQGSGPARNIGIEKATGDYIYFPDSDDVIETNAIEILVEAMQRYRSDLIIFGYKTILGDREAIKKYANKICLGQEVRENYNLYFFMSSEFGIQGAPWNKFFDLNKIREHNIRFPDLKRHQDEVFISRYVEIAERVCFIDEVLYNYYANDMKKELEKYPDNYIDIVEELYKYRLEIVNKWNPNNSELNILIRREYLGNIIRAMMFSFNKKSGLKRRQRIIWLSEQIAKKKLDTVFTVDECTSLFQRLVVRFINNINTKKLYRLLRLIVLVKYKK